MNRRKELDLHFYREDRPYEDEYNQNETEPIEQNQIVALFLREKRKTGLCLDQISLR